MPDFLDCEGVLTQLAGTRRRAERAYRAFVAAGLDADPWRELRNGIYLGSDGFARSHQPDAPLEAKTPFQQREPVRHSLQQLLAGKQERAILSAYRDHGYRLSEIAAELGVHHATVSRRLRRLERDHNRPCTR